MTRYDANAPRRPSPRSAGEPPPEGGREDAPLDLAALLAFARRRAAIVALGVALGVAVGGLYAFTAQPKYTAVASLLIDEPAQDLSRIGLAGAAAEDLVAIETQMQILRSQDVAVSVVDALDLTDNPLFIPDEPDVVSAAIARLRRGVRDALDGLISSGGEAAAQDAAGAGAGEVTPPLSPREKVAVRLRDDLDVYRVGASRAIDVVYTGNHPELAAAIANAVTHAYVQNRIDARFGAAENAGAWLRERIGQLQQRFAETARRVQAFRAEHGIVDAGEGRGLISQQALVQVNERFVEAASEAAEARARYEEVQRALAGDAVALDVVDAGDSALATELRARYLELSSERDALAARLAPGSPALEAVERELDRTAEAIRAELRRLSERLRSEMEIASARERDLRAELDSLVERATATEVAQVRLRQLESEAEVLQTAYESYLARYTDAIQRQSAPFLEARTISPALVPTGPSSPRQAMILVLSAIVGGGLGLAAAVLVEALDRRVRLPRHLEAAGLRTLGVIPAVRGARGPFRLRLRRRGLALSAREAARAKDEAGYAVSAPRSPFANGLRRAKAQIAGVLPEGRGGVVLGVAATAPGEGASTIAGNLGRLFALDGRATLVVDANLHNETLTQAGYGAGSERGAARPHALSAPALVAALSEDAGHDPDVEPSGADLLGSSRMRRLLEGLRQRYDVVILDLPAFESVPDAGVVAPMLDGIVLVVGWGRTSRPALGETVAALRRDGAAVAGGILNEARPRAMRAFGYRPLDRGYGRHAGRRAGLAETARAPRPAPTEAA
jgi:succinoglycan biosynthesis transport protein ExoP